MPAKCEIDIHRRAYMKIHCGQFRPLEPPSIFKTKYVVGQIISHGINHDEFNSRPYDTVHQRAGYRNKKHDTCQISVALTNCFSLTHQHVDLTFYRFARDGEPWAHLFRTSVRRQSARIRPVFVRSYLQHTAISYRDGNTPSRRLAVCRLRDAVRCSLCYTVRSGQLSAAVAAGKARTSEDYASMAHLFVFGLTVSCSSGCSLHTLMSEQI